MIPQKLKRLWVRLLSGFLALLLLFGLLPPLISHAADSDPLVLRATSTGEFKITLNKEDIFNKENIAPGDSWGNSIQIVNNANGRIEVCLLSIVNQLTDTTLFDLLSLQLKVGNDVIYEGSYGATAVPVTPYYSLRQGESMSLDFTVGLPIEADNEIMGKEMKATWTFDARYYKKSSPTPSYPYTVQYVDEDGNKLLDDKIATVKSGTTVTEYAPEIEGYTPNFEVQTDVINGYDQVIIFVYKKAPVPEEPTGPAITPDVPDSPDPPETPDQPDPGSGKEPPQTGVDLPEENTSVNGIIAISLLGLTLLAVLLVILRIRALKKNSSLNIRQNK